MSIIDQTDRNIFGELLLVIGGFTFAYTIVKKFLEISSNTLSWWVLPLLSVLIIISGVNLKENKENKRSFFSLLFLIISVILIVLSANDLINVWWFISFGSFFGIVMLTWTITSWINKARR